MFLSLLQLNSGLLGFLTLFLFQIKSKSNALVNIYSLITILLISIRFTALGLIQLLHLEPLQTRNLNYNGIFVLIIPCLYLYLNTLLLNRKVFMKKDLIHFILPIIFIIYKILLHPFKNTLAIPSKLTLFILFLIYAVTYWFLNFNLIGKNIWFNKNKVRIINKHTKLINKAALFLFFISTINILRALISLYLQIFNKDSFGDMNFIWIPAVVWSILFINILISPELLYGYNLFVDLIKKENIEQLEIVNVWTIKSKKEINNTHSIKLKKRIDSNIIKYIAEIEKRASNIESFKDSKYSISELAQDLRIPNSHLNYIFKYHCKISFSDYKKNNRIRHSIELIQSDYLRTSTLESLAKEVGFASYNTFFCSFKDVTGLSPKEYVVQLKA